MKKNRGYWTKEKCKEAALFSKSRLGFQKKYFTAYRKSRLNGWLDDFCSHMIPKGDKYKRCVYLIYTENEVYVGITYDFNKRNHERDGVKELKSRGSYVQLTGYVNRELAAQIEKDLIKYFKNNPNINCLNKDSGGSFGGGNGRKYIINGSPLTVREISIKHNVPYGRLKKRLYMGWCVTKAILLPKKINQYGP